MQTTEQAGNPALAEVFECFCQMIRHVGGSTAGATVRYDPEGLPDPESHVRKIDPICPTEDEDGLIRCDIDLIRKKQIRNWKAFLVYPNKLTAISQLEKFRAHGRFFLFKNGKLVLDANGRTPPRMKMGWNLSRGALDDQRIALIMKECLEDSPQLKNFLLELAGETRNLIQAGRGIIREVAERNLKIPTFEDMRSEERRRRLFFQALLRSGLFEKIRSSEANSPLELTTKGEDLLERYRSESGR